MTKRERTHAINLEKRSGTLGKASPGGAAAGTLFAIGFACWPDAQLIRNMIEPASRAPSIHGRGWSRDLARRSKEGPYGNSRIANAKLK
jgi:hypothetical protein